MFKIFIYVIVDRQTNRQTDKQTDREKSYCSKILIIPKKSLAALAPY